MRWTLKPKPDINKVKELQESLQVDEIIAISIGSTWY